MTTALPGVTFGGTFPKMAKIADRLAIVRSYQSRNGGHNYEKVLGADNSAKATISVVSSAKAMSAVGSAMPCSFLLGLSWSVSCIRSPDLVSGFSLLSPEAQGARRLPDDGRLRALRERTFLIARF